MLKKFILLLITVISFNSFSQETNSIPKDLNDKTITVVTGVSIGSISDIFMRYMLKHIKDKYGYNIILVNKPGANGAIAAKFVADSKPDGTTLLLTQDSYIFGNLKNNPGWPSKEQLTPIASLWHNHTMLIVGSNNLTSNNFLEILDDVKKNPTRYNYGCFYLIDCVIMDAILKSQSIKGVAEIPFKGTPEIKNAIKNNTIQFFVTGLGDGLSSSKAGIWKPLAMTSTKRLKDFPEVIPINAIMPNNDDFNNFYLLTALYVPNGTTREISSFYNNLFSEVNKDLEIKKFFDEKNYYLIEVENLDKTKRMFDSRWQKIKNLINN